MYPEQKEQQINKTSIEYVNKAITLCWCSLFLWGAKAVREFILYIKKIPIIFTSFFLPNIVKVCNTFLYHQIKTRLIRYLFLHTVFFASFNTWSAFLDNKLFTKIYCFQVSHFKKNFLKFINI